MTKILKEAVMHVHILTAREDTEDCVPQSMSFACKYYL